jgi:serine/threonine protein kinase
MATHLTVSVDDEDESQPKVKKVKFISEGEYGRVHEAIDANQQRCAVKQFKMCTAKHGIEPSCIREIGALQLLKSTGNTQHTMHMIDATPVKNDDGSACFHMVMEFFPYTLSQIIKHLDGTQVKRLSRQLLIGVRNMHNCGLMHRDIKPDNILVTQAGVNEWDLVVADFGLAKAVHLPGHLLTHEVVTMLYRAPELLVSYNEYNFGLDVWSFGVVILQMILHRWPWAADEIDSKTLFNIFECLGYPEPNDELLRRLYHNTTRRVEPGLMKRIQAKLNLQTSRGQTQQQVLMRYLERACSDMFTKREAKLVVDVLARAFDYNHCTRSTADQLLSMPWFATE